MNLFTSLAGFSLFAIIFASLEIVIGMRRMTHVKDVPTLVDGEAPMVSIVIPACNEEATIAPALRSVLSLNYKKYEVIVVNDRSVDKTGEVLKRIQKENPLLQIIHITDLPEGWMGKSHALQRGAMHAKGEYILFTDADIIMDETTLSRAMRHTLEKKLDHLSMFFQNTAPGGLLNALFLDMGGGLMLMFKPWKAKDPKSQRFMGVGAFNLVKASAYKDIGGHSQVAMHPIDDVMLGKVLKQHGYLQDCLLGQGFVSVKWYSTVNDFISGLMKNTFAAYHYNVGLVLIAISFIFLIGILPFWALLFTSGLTQLLYGLVVVSRLASFVKGFIDSGITPWYAGWSLITPYVTIYISLKAMITTLKNNGINWRGTHYPLDQLKNNLL